MAAYYNEFDPYAAQWLRNLIAAGHIAPGDVDERSIEDVHPDDLKPYTQCHFFAGVGVWSYALRRAGWPDDRPVWTGSCPCQPFSAAGAGAGFDDQRHLWPHFHWLISQRQPAIVFGEQVASKDAEPWLDLVQADMEAMDYAFGAVAFPSAGVGAPHIRDRTYWVANSSGQRQHRRRPSGTSNGRDPSRFELERLRDASGMAKTDGVRLEQASGRELHYAEHHLEPRGSAQRMADADCDGQRASWRPGMHCQGEARPLAEQCGPVNGLWADADWLFCRDGKWRPVESCPQPLADGSSESLGRVRAEVITQVEEEINAATAQAKGGRAEAMRTLLQALREEAQRCWPFGGLPGLHEAPFLLAFVRQLQEQGWQIAKGVALPRSEASSGLLRGLRDDATAASASHRRGLEEQRPGQSANIVRVLSCILARHAQASWDDAYAAHAEVGFPLAIGARSRVGRLRGYGNAINAEAATQFIAAYLETLNP